MKPAMPVMLGICALFAFGPGVAVAQQMGPGAAMMVLGKTVEGVVSRVRFVACRETPQTCQGIFEITPSAKGEMMQGGTMMQKPEAGMMMEHPITVIVIPGTALIWQNGPIPLTRLHAGDLVKIVYRELSNMNVAITLTMTGMGHM